MKLIHQGIGHESGETELFYLAGKRAVQVITSHFRIFAVNSQIYKL
jgi:hypothetical protein